MAVQLRRQMTQIIKNHNEGSFQTKERYAAAGYRFADFLEEKFKLQKFANVSNKHLFAYIEKLKSDGASPAYLKTELSGIRWLHSRCQGAKNRLANNKQLEIPDRHTGRENRAYTPEEFEKLKEAAMKRGRYDVYYAVRLHATFGLRNAGAVMLKLSQVREAIDSGFLTVKEKGGKVRAVPVMTESQRQLLDELIAYAKAQGRTSHEAIIPRNTSKGSIKTAKRSIQDFLYRYRDEWTNRDIRAGPVIEGRKPYSENLSAHSGRYMYAQHMNQHLMENEGLSAKDTKLKISQMLGHERGRITNTYLES